MSRYLIFIVQTSRKSCFKNQIGVFGNICKFEDIGIRILSSTCTAKFILSATERIQVYISAVYYLQVYMFLLTLFVAFIRVFLLSFFSVLSLKFIFCYTQVEKVTPFFSIVLSFVALNMYEFKTII